MKAEKTFLLCEICENLVGVIKDSGVPISCCGQDMTHLEPNTVDAAQEKHVPVVVREGNKVKVTVGSVPHPMGKDHHVAWIVLAEGGCCTTRVQLSVDGEPSATFTVCDEKAPVTVYEYCNLHGLWATEA